MAAPAAEGSAFPAYTLDLAGLLDRGLVIGLSVLKALLILGVGWIIARVARAVLVRLLRRTPVDRYLSSLLTGGRRKDLGVEKILGSLVYGLLMLFVSIEVLRALGLTMVTEPLTDLITSLVGFLPQLMAAGTLAVIAWSLARVARMMARSFLQSIAFENRLGEAAGEGDGAGGKQSALLGRALSDVVFYFVLLFFLPQILDALQMEGLSPVREMVGQILSLVPKLLGAGFVLTVFYFVARIVQRLAVPLLASLGVDRLPEILGVTVKSGPKASVAAGWVVLAGMLFVGAIQAANSLGLSVVSEVLQGLLAGSFRVLVACGIFAFGLWGSRKLASTLADWEQGRGSSGTPLATTARVLVLVMAGAMALGQAGLAPEILHLAIGAAALGVAIAGGLAFGLGGREHASRWIASRRGDS
ncbi:MAG: mechanosensitive ion channel [Acidobacteriota bacterium]